MAALPVSRDSNNARNIHHDRPCNTDRSPPLPHHLLRRPPLGPPPGPAAGGAFRHGGVPATEGVLVRLPQPLRVAVQRDVGREDLGDTALRSIARASPSVEAPTQP